MIILDACNWRVLSILRPNWEVKPVLSRGSSTPEWLRKSFVEPLKDVVHISANPFIFELEDVRKMFKRVIDLHLFCWDEKLFTVRPSSVSLFVKEVLATGETKMIVHYMQPHAPFLTSTWLNSYSQDYRKRLLAPRAYDLAMKSFEARKEFKREYIENVAAVAKHVESLIKYVKDYDADFKIVLTSDHSELLRGHYSPLRDKRKIWIWVGWILGIYRFVGHETRSRYKQLYEVPWITF